MITSIRSSQAERFPRIVLLVLLALAVVAVAAQAQATALTNGDFETGDLSGWTTFTNPNGTLGHGFPLVFPKAVLFDTNNDSTATLSAQFRVGQITFMPGGSSGGGIFQDVNLSVGDLTIAADIAAKHPGSLTNVAGHFRLLVDGVVVDSHDFGLISPITTEHNVLTATVPISSQGFHEIRFEITRSGLQGTATPQQFIDNVVLSGSATVGAKQVDIDIRPHNDINTIRIGGGKRVEVAVLSTDTFDAPNEVDAESLTFGVTGDEGSLEGCPGRGEDVNRDGLLDLLCNFRVAQTGFEEGDTFGILKGSLLDGTPIEGSDSVLIVERGHE